MLMRSCCPAVESQNVADPRDATQTFIGCLECTYHKARSTAIMLVCVHQGCSLASRSLTAWSADGVCGVAESSVYEVPSCSYAMHLEKITVAVAPRSTSTTLSQQTADRQPLRARR